MAPEITGLFCLKYVCIFTSIMIRKLTTPILIDGKNHTLCCGSLVNGGKFVVVMINKESGRNDHYSVYVAKANKNFAIQTKSGNIHDHKKYLQQEGTQVYLWKEYIGSYELEHDLNQPKFIENGTIPDEPAQDSATERFKFDIPKELVQD